MATSRDIRAGGAFVELYLKGGHLVEQGLDKVAAKTKAFANTIATVASISNITYGHTAVAVRTSLTTAAKTIDAVASGIQKTVRNTSKVVTQSLEAIPKTIDRVGNAFQALGNDQ